MLELDHKSLCKEEPLYNKTSLDLILSFVHLLHSSVIIVVICIFFNTFVCFISVAIIDLHILNRVSIAYLSLVAYQISVMNIFRSKFLFQFFQVLIWKT